MAGDREEVKPEDLTNLDCSPNAGLKTTTVFKKLVSAVAIIARYFKKITSLVLENKKNCHHFCWTQPLDYY